MMLFQMSQKVGSDHHAITPGKGSVPFAVWKQVETKLDGSSRLVSSHISSVISMVTAVSFQIRTPTTCLFQEQLARIRTHALGHNPQTTVIAEGHFHVQIPLMDS